MIILATTSPRRIEIFQRLGISFKCVSPIFDESSISNFHDPYLLPEFLAGKKAQSVSGKYYEDIILAFDTVVIHDNRILGKPKDLKEAKNFLTELSGNFHDVVSGCAIIAQTKNIFHTFSDTSRVKFKVLPPGIIDEYIRKVNTLDKAGAYAVQEYGEMLIDHTEGSIENIIGLPTEKLLDCLKKHNIA